MYIFIIIVKITDLVSMCKFKKVAMDFFASLHGWSDQHICAYIHMSVHCGYGWQDGVLFST